MNAVAQYQRFHQSNRTRAFIACLISVGLIIATVIIIGAHNPNPTSHYFVPITITNPAASTVPINFQQMLTIDWTKYSSYLQSGVQNVAFYDSSNNTLNAWCESSCASHRTASIVFVNLGGNTISGGGGTLTIYMRFLPISINNMAGGNSSSWGECPTCSSNYGKYDNGQSVFKYYADFMGLSLPDGWNRTGATVNNGLILSGTCLAGCYIISLSSYGNGTMLDVQDGTPTIMNSGASFPASLSALSIWNPPYDCLANIWDTEAGTPNYNYGSCSYIVNPIKAESVTPSSMPTGTTHIFSIGNDGTDASYYLDYVMQNVTYPTQSAVNHIIIETAHGTPLKVNWLDIRLNPPDNMMPTVEFDALAHQSKR